MSVLEQELQALSPDAFPETPDLIAFVRQRLEDEPAPAPARRRRRRSALVLMLAVVAVAIGAAFAVQPARSTILRWFGIGGVSVQFVDRLPVVPLDRTPIIGAHCGTARDAKQVRFGERVAERALERCPTRAKSGPDQCAENHAGKS